MFGIMKLCQLLENGRNKSEFSLTPRRLLQLATIDGACSIGEDGRIGSIVPGKRADLIMVHTIGITMGKFTDDPAHLLVEAAAPANVDTVIVDGRILKQNGKLVGVETPQLVRDAQASMTGIFQRTHAR
jgi:cytosine/adenosine deaminase-related metal-dependent hydrolase